MPVHVARACTQVRINDVLTKMQESPDILLTDESDPIADSRLRPAALVHQDKHVVGSFLGMCPWILASKQAEFGSELFFGIQLKDQSPFGLGLRVRCYSVPSETLYLAVPLRSIVYGQGRQTALL